MSKRKEMIQRWMDNIEWMKRRIQVQDYKCFNPIHEYTGASVRHYYPVDVEVEQAKIDEALIMVKKAIAAALVSRGSNRGMLKTKCPPMGTMGAAAWQAITAQANPYKVGFGHIFFMRGNEKDMFDYITEYIESSQIDVRSLDRDRKALDLILNVW